MKKGYIFIDYFILPIFIGVLVVYGSTIKQENTGEYVDNSVSKAVIESQPPADDEVQGYATRIVVIKIQDIPAHNDLSDIPPERYEFAVIHAENIDGKLSINRLEIPMEGYDFSNDLKTRIRPPSFSDAGFPFDGQDKELTISLHY